MPKAKKARIVWYGVREGRRPGVYETWAETEAQVSLTVINAHTGQEVSRRSA